ncbi:hypothetical protein SK128_020143 [Halocaridina rubra]|uniref:Glutathione peroxidase n=1 Tax=Halocaridina rubra TaxID=373956 RepID=A0AAN8ZY25_HALRR
MARFLSFLLGASLVIPTLGEKFLRRECKYVSNDLYQFSATLLNSSKKVDFSDYKGKVVLVYNVATF